MHTLCLRSSDAKKIDEGTYRWTPKSQNLKAIAGKVMLSSIELPMSQWSVESRWSRVYCMERIRLSTGTRRVELREVADGSVATTAKAVLPLHLNPIAQIASDGTSVRIDTTEPHALSAGLFRWLADQEDHVKVVASSADTIDVSRAWTDGRLTIETPTRLRITPLMSQPVFSHSGGYLLFPSPSTPKALADMLTSVLREQEGSLGRRASVTYDAEECAFDAALGSFPSADTARTTLSVGGDRLASLMGFDPSGHTSTRTFMRTNLDPRTVMVPGYTSAQSRAFLQQNIHSHVGAGDVPPLAVRGDARGMFAHARLRPGWYAPSQRIYSTSPPLSLPHEWDLQFARFFFPRTDEPPGLVFTDPHGTPRIAEIAPGVYTAESMAAYLEHLMNQDKPGYEFSVRFDDKRFTFHCSAAGMGLSFSILFAHPRSVDPSKLGFEEANLEGSDTYTSSDPIHVPTTPFGPLRNLCRISEVPGQRKFCIRPTARPSVIAIATAYDARSRTLSLRCVNSSNDAVAHGLGVGTVVVLSASGFTQDQDADGSKRNNSIPRGTTTLAVVARGVETKLVTTLDIEVPPLPWVYEAAEKSHAMNISTSTEPCSFAFCKNLHQSIGGDRLGFPSTTMQWGEDGSVRTRKLRIPPFISPGSHNLDHVDYLLLRLKEANKSTTIHHEFNGEAIAVFGKVCLNPTFRNERHLPVELNLSGGDRLDTLSIEFLNPDHTPYHFHDAQFSLSLSFVS